ncbi:MAG: hypothetical protein SA339_05555 [Methanomassiliicoccus sp.]|nr:hypothetical protein [Methanomassiliicoccus sp.]
MAVVDLIDLVDQRLAQFEADEEEIRTEETYLAGETGIWCLLSIFDDGTDELIGFEFIETAESWKRPDAILEYNETVTEGFNVLVIVPDDSFVEMNELLARAGDSTIMVSDYSAMELVPRVLAG